MAMFSKKLNKRNENDVESFKKMSELFTRSSNSIQTTPRLGFKEALKSRLHEARAEHKYMSKFSLLQWLAMHQRQFATVGVSALVVVIIAVLVIQPFTPSILPTPTVYAQDNFTLSAESEDSLGIEAETSFWLESKEPMKVSDIENQLSTNLDLEFELEQINDRKIRIDFSEPLTDDELVKFRLETQATTLAGEVVPRPYAWAFQVKPVFQLYNSIPGDRAIRVPLDSGIELNFSHENIDLDSVQNAFSIKPSVEGHFEQFRRTTVFVPEKLAEGTVYQVTVDGSVGLDGSDEILGEEFVFEFETVDPSVESESYRSAYISLRENSINVTPKERPTIDFSYYRMDRPSAKVELYRFNSFEDYADVATETPNYYWRQFADIEDLVDLSFLTYETDFNPEIGKEGYQNYFVFPEPLAQGII